MRLIYNTGKINEKDNMGLVNICKFIYLKLWIQKVKIKCKHFMKANLETPTIYENIFTLLMCDIL